MALPPNNDTPRGQQLMAIVRAAKEDISQKWENPTKDDLALIGAVIVMYSNMELNLRRFVEILDHENMLPERWKGKSGRLPVGDLETIVEAMPDMSPPNIFALQRIREGRKLRNLLAHLAIKKIPNEDGFVFVSKDEQDFKTILDSTPTPGQVMVSVADGQQLRNMIKMLDGAQMWLAQATKDIEDQHFKKKGASKRSPDKA